MYRKIIIRLVSVIVAAVIIYIAAGQYKAAGASSYRRTVDREMPEEILYQELESYRESLEGTVAELRAELADKKNELSGLDRKLYDLEAQYNMLLEESKRIAERLEYLEGAQ